jgi:hypothetical protein
MPLLLMLGGFIAGVWAQKSYPTLGANLPTLPPISSSTTTVKQLGGTATPTNTNGSPMMAPSNTSQGS